MTSSKFGTREEWLQAAVTALRPEFQQRAKVSIPEALRVSCGWPSVGGKGTRKQRIGECWHPTSSKDGTTEVFISPVLGDAHEALAVLVHELVHAAVGCDAGHGPGFRRPAVAMGLEGRMTATTASAALKARLRTLSDSLGTYPHAALQTGSRPSDAPKKQGTRMVKCECPDCGYILRTTQKWLDVATPDCPACDVTMNVAGGAGPMED